MTYYSLQVSGNDIRGIVKFDCDEAVYNMLQVGQFYVLDLTIETWFNRISIKVKGVARDEK